MYVREKNQNMKWIDWMFWKNIDQNIVAIGYTILHQSHSHIAIETDISLIFHKTSSAVTACYCSAWFHLFYLQVTNLQFVKNMSHILKYRVFMNQSSESEWVNLTLNHFPIRSIWSPPTPVILSQRLAQKISKVSAQ